MPKPPTIRITMSFDRTMVSLEMQAFSDAFAKNRCSAQRPNGGAHRRHLNGTATRQRNGQGGGGVRCSAMLGRLAVLRSLLLELDTALRLVEVPKVIADLPSR